MADGIVALSLGTLLIWLTWSTPRNDSENGCFTFSVLMLGVMLIIIGLFAIIINLKI